jgi:hypothetical protein
MVPEEGQRQNRRFANARNAGEHRGKFFVVGQERERVPESAKVALVKLILAACLKLRALGLEPEDQDAESPRAG